MSSLCDCLRYAFGGPVSDPASCSEERRRVRVEDAWHASQAYHLRHLGRTGRLGFRKLAATSAQLAPLELPLLRQSVVEAADRQSNLSQTSYAHEGELLEYTHEGNSADPASSRALCMHTCQASSSRERVWSPVGARGANGSSRRTAATREKSSLLRVQLAAGGGVSGGMARPAPDRWASSGSSTAGGSRRGGCGAAGPPGGGHGPQFHFTAAEGLLSEHASAARMPCCEHSTPPPGPVLPTLRRERTESSGGKPDSGGAAGAPLRPSASCSQHLNLLSALFSRPSRPPKPAALAQSKFFT